MKKRRLNLLTSSRRNKQVNISENGGENVLPLPIDLVFEIFSRLPVKSIARCRCVSKIWSSMLSHTEFAELFLRKSYARPQLLFVCYHGNEVVIFSSPQPQNPDENSPPIIANHQMSFSYDGGCSFSGVVNGLVCILKYKSLSNGTTETVPVICNPSTKQFLPLKKVKTRRADVKSLFGYDPIDKRFKILSMTWGRNKVEEEHQVLTLGTDKWRMVEYCLPGRHLSLDKELCSINGVLYYYHFTLSTICCFDIRSEKFSFIKLKETYRYLALVNYDSNLGLIWSNGPFDQTSTNLKLWVLEDVERQEWSKRIIALPPLWKSVVGQNTLRVVGVTDTNEIVFESHFPSPTMCLFYLNIDKNTVVRLEIQGIKRYLYNGIDIFINHVEDMKLI